MRSNIATTLSLSLSLFFAACGGPSGVANATRRFLQQLEARTGKRPLIYTGYYFWRDQVGDPGGFNQYPLVMAAYVSGCPLVPDSWGRFTMWQYTSSGSVGGI